MKALRLLVVPLASLRFLPSAIPFAACVPALRSSSGIRTLLPGGRGLPLAVTPLPLHRHGGNETSQVPGRPYSAFALLSDPGRTSASGPYDVSVLSPLSPPQRLRRFQLYFEAPSHGFCDRCLRFTATVTCGHARLASNCSPSFVGSDWLPTGSLRKVSADSILLPQASLGARAV
jgi:hypothetical protein